MGIVRLPVPTARCPGYVSDHIKPRKEGGAEEPWQTGQDAIARSAFASHGSAGRMARFPNYKCSVDPLTCSAADRNHAYKEPPCTKGPGVILDAP